MDWTTRSRLPTTFSILCITPLIFLPLYPPPEGDRGRIFPQASLCFRHFLTQVVCKWLQPFVVSVIIGFIGFWFFPHCFRVPFPPPAPPPSGDSGQPRFQWILCRCVSQERHGQTIPVQDIQGHGLSMPPNPIA